VREWSCQWRGVHITVQKWTRGFRTGERLLVDGIGIDSDESWIWSPYAYLAGPVSLLGSRHVIEAIIGQGKGWYRTVCPIIVDGYTVGGDRDLPLGVGDLQECAREWAQTRERGILPFR